MVLFKPIRLEKKGLVLGKPKLENKSAFSKKNCRCSGKNNSNRLRLVTCLSTSTCEKSGCMVKSKFKAEVKLIFASIPMSLPISLGFVILSPAALV